MTFPPMAPRAAPIALLLAGSLALAACNFSTAATPQGDTVATSAAQTVAAELTQNADPVTQPPPTATSLPATAVPETTATPNAATATPDSESCTDRAAFEADVTVPDDTEFAPGETFTKTWRLRNAGSCTWTTNYSLVFDRGDQMGADDSVPLPGTVAPGSTVEVSVSMTAPDSDDTYQGFWQLENDAGETFGIGADADVAFWVRIVVGPEEASVVYDFVANYCDAEWRSGAGVLPCPGTDTDSEGFVIRLDNARYENGVTENEPSLETHPEWVNNGVISGRFPEFTVQDGDRFRTVIGCRHNGNDCDVNFQLNYRDSSDTLHPLGEWHEVYDGSIHPLDVDLSSLAGDTVRFVLAVTANGSSSQDWALWLAPRIVR